MLHPYDAARRRVILPLAGVLVLSLAAAAAADEQETWHVLPDESQLVVHVQPAGLFAGFLQSHHFVPADWHGTLRFDPGALDDVRVEVVVVADSLKNQQPELSEEDHQTVAQQVRSAEILDVATYPEIRLSAREVRVEERLGEEGEEADGIQGVLAGDITIRGVTQPVEMPFTARWTPEHLRAAGRATLRQTEFGIEPYSRFLGTVAVANEVEVEFTIEAVRDTLAFFEPNGLGR